MQDNKDRYPVTKMATILGVSRSAYYQWEQGAGARARREEDEAELAAILRKLCEEEHHYRYGWRRVQAELLDTYGVRVNHKKLVKLMRKYGLNARGRRKFIPTTNSNHGFKVCENLLNRDFQAAGPGEKWVSDITYLRTAAGWLYLTVVLDLYDRKIVGWAFSGTMEAGATVVKAWEMACGNRQPQPDVLFHSDRGVQYCSTVFRETLKRQCPQVRQSMSRKGNCWDNACAESFFKTLKRELETLDGRQSATAVSASVFYYIEAYYNRIRRHSALDYVAPMNVALEKVG
jgi:transposase InsO family protein